jgi:hypothetical protein
MTNSTTDKSITHVSIGLTNDITRKVSPAPTNLTQALRRALIEQPGALGVTWISRRDSEHEAAKFCQASPADCAASAKGDYHARVFELPGDRWGVVVWYAFASGVNEDENIRY